MMSSRPVIQLGDSAVYAELGYDRTSKLCSRLVTDLSMFGVHSLVNDVRKMFVLPVLMYIDVFENNRSCCKIKEVNR